MACGTPVITYKTGGSPEAVDDMTGIVIEQGNIDGLVNAIIQMKNNPLLSSACRKRAEMCLIRTNAMKSIFVYIRESLIIIKLAIVLGFIVKEAD